MKFNNDTNDPRYTELKKIYEEVLNLKKSPLYTYRTENNYHPVIGEGSHYAGIMFIGEAPGENEAKTGRPFAGAAGRILNELLTSIDASRKDVYITNIVKDRPPKNRDPLPEEIELYAPYLDRQINIIKPNCIATLGRYSMSYIMEHYGLKDQLRSISALHGKKFIITYGEKTVTYIPLYHPAVALYTGSIKKVMFEDFKILKQFLVNH